MKPIFISYSSRHRELTRQLAAVLEAQYGPGSVWWDHELEARTAHDKQIRAALDGSRVVIVIWTAGARISDYARAEAARALEQGKLVNIRPADLSFRDVPEPFRVQHFDDAEDLDSILRTVGRVWEGVRMPTQVPLHELYFRQHGQHLIDGKQSTLDSDVTKIRPTELLQAQFQTVGYSDMTGMRAEMLAWCTSAKRAAGRLIHGASGIGKTRLMIEVAAQLRSQRWTAGFFGLPISPNEGVRQQRWQALEQLLAHGDDSGLLIVMDDAEARVDELAQLSAAIFNTAERSPRPVRLVLLARSADRWWPALISEQLELQRLFHRKAGETDVIALPGVDTREDRLAFFQHCVDGLAAILQAKDDRPPQTRFPLALCQRIANGEGYARPLAVVMEALLYLAAATPKVPGIDQQLDSVLELERDHWETLLGKAEGAAKKIRDRDMNRGVAQITAVGGVATRPAAERLLMADAFYVGTRTARIYVDPIYRHLATVYGQADEALAPLQPGLVGEHQIASIGDVELIESCLRWIDGEPEAERDQRRRGLLRVLQRATLPEHGTRTLRAAAFLKHLVETRLPSLAGEMLAVIADTPGQLEAVLTARVAELNDDDTLAALDAALPLQSRALMDLSLAVAERRVALARQAIAAHDDGGEEAQSEDAGLASWNRLAGRLHILCVRMSNLGLREEALAASQELVEVYRQLAENQPDVFLPELALSLNARVVMLSDLGPREEALLASQELVDVYRWLAEARPEDFLPDLATSLELLRQFSREEEPDESAHSACEENLAVTAALAEPDPQELGDLPEGFERSDDRVPEEAGSNADIALPVFVAEDTGAVRDGSDEQPPVFEDVAGAAIAEPQIQELAPEIALQDSIDVTPDDLPVEEVAVTVIDEPAIAVLAATDEGEMVVAGEAQRGATDEDAAIVDDVHAASGQDEQPLPCAHPAADMRDNQEPDSTPVQSAAVDPHLDADAYAETASLTTDATESGEAAVSSEQAVAARAPEPAPSLFDGRIPIVIGATGHRDLGDREAALAGAITKECRKLRDAYPNTPFLVLSALAEGADRLVATVAMRELDARLCAVLPLPPEEYEKDFADEISCQAFWVLLAKAERRIDVYDVDDAGEWSTPGKARNLQYAHQAGRIAEQAQILFAVWDGKPACGTTGPMGDTAEMVTWFRRGYPPRRFSASPEEVPLLDRSETGLLLRIDPATGDVEASAIDAENGGTPAESADGRGSTIREILEATERFDKDIRRKARQVARGKPLIDAMPDGAPLEAAAVYRASDALASHYADAVRLTHYLVYNLALAALFLCNVVSNVPVAPCAYLTATGMTAFATLYMWRRSLAVRCIAYRGLAEAVRVLFFLRMSGIDSPIWLSDVPKRAGKMRWLRQAVRALECCDDSRRHAPRMADGLALTKKFWVDQQIAYHRSCGHRRWYGIVATIARTAFVLSLALALTLSVAAHLATPAGNSWDAHLVLDWANQTVPGTQLTYKAVAIRLQLVLTLLAAAAIAACAILVRHADPARVGQSVAARQMFERADRNLDEAVRIGADADWTPREIIATLGRGALQENAEWLSATRSSMISPARKSRK